MMRTRAMIDIRGPAAAGRRVTNQCDTSLMKSHSQYTALVARFHLEKLQIETQTKEQGGATAMPR